MTVIANLTYLCLLFQSGTGSRIVVSYTLMLRPRIVQWHGLIIAYEPHKNLPINTGNETKAKHRNTGNGNAHIRVTEMIILYIHIVDNKILDYFKF